MSDRAFLIQDWTTVRGTGTAQAAIVQSEERSLDVTGYADMTYWLDVPEVTPPGSNSSNYVQLFLETAPTYDDIPNPAVPTQSWFQPTTGDLRFGTGGSSSPYIQASTTPLVVNSLRSPNTVSLSRYLRWRIVPSTTGAWDLTFRIRGVPNRSGFFAPTDVNGCVLWLRSDAGITPSGSGQAMSTWADLSGLGNNAAAGGTSPPVYNASGGVSNMPRVTGTTSGYMTGGLSPNVAEHTLFTVVTYPSLANCGAFAATNSSFGVNSGFSLFTEIASNGIVGRAGNGSSSIASAVDTNLSTLGTTFPSIYSTLATSNGTVDIVANGGNGGSASTATAFTLFSCPNYVLFSLDRTQYFLNNDAYEYILFNRALTSAERTRVTRYLGGRYGIAVP